MNTQQITELAVAAGATLGAGVFSVRRTRAEAASIIVESADRATMRAIRAMQDSLSRVEEDLKNALTRLDECETDRQHLHRQVEQLERRVDRHQDK
jgi:chromosome segregation ATPase